MNTPKLVYVLYQLTYSTFELIMENDKYALYMDGNRPFVIPKDEDGHLKSFGSDPSQQNYHLDKLIMLKLWRNRLSNQCMIIDKDIAKLAGEEEE